MFSQSTLNLVESSYPVQNFREIVQAEVSTHDMHFKGTTRIFLPSPLPPKQRWIVTSPFYSETNISQGGGVLGEGQRNHILCCYEQITWQSLNSFCPDCELIGEVIHDWFDWLIVFLWLMNWLIDLLMLYLIDLLLDCLIDSLIN